MDSQVLGAASVLFSGVDDGVAKAAKNSESALGRFGSFAIKSLGGVALAAGAAALSVAGIGAVGLGAGIKMAADLEQTTVAFTVLTGSAEKAKQLLDDITQFAATTPFQMPGLQDAAKQLAAFGFAPEHIIPVLRNLGDIAAGTGADLGDLTQIYGRIRLAGKAAMDDINRFTDRGIPILTALADQLGVSVAEVRKMVEHGKIGFPEVSKALASMTGEGGMFADMMAKQSTTVNGLVSTLKDNLAITLRDVGAEFLRAFNVGDTLTDAVDFVGGLHDAIVQVSAQVFDLVAGPLVSVGKWVLSAADDVGMFIRFVGASIMSIPDFLDYVGAKMVYAISMAYDQWRWLLVDAIPGFLSWFADNWREVLIDAYNLQATVFSNIATNIWNLLKAVAGWLAGDGFDFKWTGLVEGFKSSIKELPEIGPVIESELTRGAQKNAEDAGARIGRRFLDAFQSNIKGGSATAPAQAPKTIEDVLGEINAADAAKGGAKTEAAAQAKGAGSKQTTTSLTDAFKNLQEAALQMAEQQKQTKALEGINRSVDQMVKEQQKTNQAIGNAVDNTYGE